VTWRNKPRVLVPAPRPGLGCFSAAGLLHRRAFPACGPNSTSPPAPADLNFPPCPSPFVSVNPPDVVRGCRRAHRVAERTRHIQGSCRSPRIETCRRVRTLIQQPSVRPPSPAPRTPTLSPHLRFFAGFGRGALVFFCRGFPRREDKHVGPWNHSTISFQFTRHAGVNPSPKCCRSRPAV